MCARYQTPSQAAAERYWSVIEPLWQFEPSWRVLPTQQIPVVLALNGMVTGRMMRWGLIPYSGSTSYPLINATVEKLTNCRRTSSWRRSTTTSRGCRRWLREEDHAARLAGSLEQAMQCLKPYPSDGMEAWQVSRRLNANEALDDEGLIERVGQ